MHILQVTPYFFPHFGGVESHVLGLSGGVKVMGGSESSIGSAPTFKMTYNHGRISLLF